MGPMEHLGHCCPRHPQSLWDERPCTIPCCHEEDKRGLETLTEA